MRSAIFLVEDGSGDTLVGVFPQTIFGRPTLASVRLLSDAKWRILILTIATFAALC